MIRLRDILTEISLASVEPYATQFVWRQPHPEDDIWESDFNAETASSSTHRIKMVMQRWRTPVPDHEYEYQFAFMTRDRSDSGWTTASHMTNTAGAVSVLALLKTVALAIRDFADQRPDCTVIDITGSDPAAQKGEQKSRIYAELFRENGMHTEFTMKSYGGKLYLIRMGIRGRTADATGVSDD